MTHRYRTLTVFALITVGFVASLYVIARTVLYGSFLDLEADDARSTAERAINALTSRLTTIETSTSDWAEWDDTYAFIVDRNEAYIDSNLITGAFTNLGVNIMLYVNTDGEIVYGKAVDLDAEEEVPLPDTLETHLDPDGALLRSFELHGRYGIVILPEGPLLITAHPILTSESEGPSRGALVWGRFLDDALVSTLADQERLALRYEPWNAEAVAGARAALEYRAVTSEPVGNDTVIGYGRVDDIYGNPALVAVVALPRTIVQQGQRSLAYFLLMLTLTGLLFLTAVSILHRRVTFAYGQVGVILDNSSDAIALADMEGIIREANPAFQRLFGDRSKKSFTEIACPDHRHRLIELFETVVKQHTPSRIELPIKDQHGTPFEADVVLSPVRTYGNRLRGVVFSLRDISKHKELEAQLQKTLAEETALSQLKSRIVSVTSHELRTPLAVIQLSSELLQRYNDRLPNDAKREHLDQIVEGTHRMSEIVEDVLVFNQVESGHVALNLAPTDLVAFCEKLIDEHKRTFGRDRNFSLDVTGAPHTILLDQKLMGHILTNVLSNAIKFSPSGSTIKVVIDYGTEAVALSVQDSGVGIPEADQSRLFEPFFRASNADDIQGTGLGLAIVKQAAELHKARLALRSAPGQGTTVSIILPQPEPEPVS